MECIKEVLLNIFSSKTHLSYFQAMLSLPPIPSLLLSQRRAQPLSLSQNNKEIKWKKLSYTEF